MLLFDQRNLTNKLCFSGDMYAGDGDVACDQYHKYKVSDPGVYLERTKRNC